MKNSQRSMLYLLGICFFSLQWMLTHQEVDVALGGKATQSSTNKNFVANLALDGNRDSNIDSYSCACTEYTSNPWWRVDLLEVYDISNVIVTNRGDCCSEQINGAEILIGNSLDNYGNNNPSCVVISSIAAGGSANYTCNMKGRYVNIIIPDIEQVLTLCEVEVYGVPVRVIKRAFLKLKFNSTEDLIDPTVRDSVLQKIKSASVQSSVIQVKWTKEPELETET